MEMTPREKAEELFNKFFNKFPLRVTKKEIDDDFEFSRECTLIAVEEIQNQLVINCKFYDVKYWQEVKTEIEKL